jgi:hypothetical protein
MQKRPDGKKPMDVQKTMEQVILKKASLRQRAQSQARRLARQGGVEKAADRNVKRRVIVRGPAADKASEGGVALRICFSEMSASFLRRLHRCEARTGAGQASDLLVFLGRQDPAKVKELDARLMAWLDAEAEHAHRFFADPLRALALAKCDLDPRLVRKIEGARQQQRAALKGMHWVPVRTLSFWVKTNPSVQQDPGPSKRSPQG